MFKPDFLNQGGHDQDIGKPDRTVSIAEADAGKTMIVRIYRPGNKVYIKYYTLSLPFCNPRRPAVLSTQVKVDSL